ncbi:MAG: hypothetical protein AAB840_02455, partial [Patescibacteria group bacterium]
MPTPKSADIFQKIKEFSCAFWALILDILFPKSALQVYLENITPEEIMMTAGAPDDNIPPYKAFLSYRNPIVRQMIWLLKYRGNEVVAKKLAKILADGAVEDI